MRGAHKTGGGDSKRVEERRGRIAHATYARMVGQALTRDWFALESCRSYEALTQLELVGRLVEEHPERYPSRGWAARALLDKAIDDVIVLCRSKPDPASARLARFLETRREGKTITAIALEWGLSRECVSRKVGHQAVLLVTDRVLARNRRCSTTGRAAGREVVALPVRAGLQSAIQHTA